MSTLFPPTTPKPARTSAPADNAYSAEHIEVLEGLEPVRRRPGMYIGGTDSRALHHLVAELVDNAMDEAVAGHASRIDLSVEAGGFVTVRDNGRGIPVDPHPKFPGKAALEVILTTLHSGGKFGGEAYQTSGGLHGVGLSVVNALSDDLQVEIYRDKHVWRQNYARGVPVTPLTSEPLTRLTKGTSIRFHPDPEIFGDQAFEPARLYRMALSKAYLFHGVQIHWRVDPRLLSDGDTTPQTATIHFPRGLQDYLEDTLQKQNAETVGGLFCGRIDFNDQAGRLEWATAWVMGQENPEICSYCNTIPTPSGGTHEQGFRGALVRGLREYGDRLKNRKAALLTADDVLGSTQGVLSLFIKEPQFQGQTKEKLVNPEVTRLVENALKDHFDHWLAAHTSAANAILEHAIALMEERQSRKASKELARQSATRRMRLPGKLADCTKRNREGTELFLVEGDSAGGSAKQSRARETQAVLPLRGKLLNVANATTDKLLQSERIGDLVQAVGCGVRKACDLKNLRYERIIIMTDADIDGAHIAALLMTFFFQEMRPLIEAGHLFLAQPPLFKLQVGSTTHYALDEAEKDHLLKTTFKGRNVDISRFKGLGEMSAQQLKETTMDPKRRRLLRVVLPDSSFAQNEGELVARQRFVTASVEDFVDQLMGSRPERRFAFIQENAPFVQDLDV